MPKYRTADEQYNELVRLILDDGIDDDPSTVRTKYADGKPAPTKAILNYQMKFDNSNEFPIITTKRVALKDCIKELFWIWQLQSNNVNVLEDMGCKVWSEWKDEKGEIGKAYGWQLKNRLQPIDIDELFVDMFFDGKFSFKPTENDINYGREKYKASITKSHYIKLNQVDYLLYMLKKNPHSRRHKTTLWNVEDLHEMALQPCVYNSHWQVQGNKLHLTVNIRSNDVGLGNCYNVSQYAILHRLIAQASDLIPGELCFNIDNAHIYDRHIDLIQQQIKGETHEPPTLWINPDVKSFYDFTLDDIRVDNYKHNGTFRYEIAI